MYVEGSCYRMGRFCMRDLVFVKNNRYYIDIGIYDIRRKNLVIVIIIGKW